MARVPEPTVESVVAEVSEKMSDPSYAQLAIGSFAQAHPDVGRFITAHLEELGGGEGVMHAVFHAEVVHECFRRHLGRHLTPIGFRALDAVSFGDPEKRFTQLQPAIASYLVSNIDQPAMRRLLSLVGLAMDEAS
ncbi:MAG: hypothetical protein AB7S26_34370 [Sandaracinaceae bacterium]